MNPTGNPHKPNTATARVPLPESAASMQEELQSLRQKIEEQEWTLNQLDHIVGEFYSAYPEHTQAVPIVRPGENPLIATIRCLVQSLDRQGQRFERARAKASAMAESKDTFLASISHEIRTPMNGILGMLSLVLETNLTDEQRDYLDTVHRSTNSLLRILNDVLDYSKICSKQVELEQRPFAPATVLEDVLQVFGPNAQAKGVALRSSVAETAPTQVVGDDLRLQQILWNLVNNAIKFTENGSVDVSIAAAADDRHSTYHQLWFEIADTGVGMNEEQLSRLFKPYSQGDVSTTRQYGGTGLGLAISKNLVELMGGEIEVESTPGVGSAFRFHVQLRRADPIQALEPAPIRPMAPPPAQTMPRVSQTPDVMVTARHVTGQITGPVRKDTGPTLKPVSAMPASIPEPTSRISTPRKVLLVEDNEINQKVAQLTLERLGYTVDVASDGLEALEACKVENYDVICMDLNMPQMDGLETTRQIRQLPMPSSQARIIATTGHAFSDDRRRCLEAGMDEFVSKPFEIKQLRDAIERACSMERLPQPVDRDGYRRTA